MARVRTPVSSRVRPAVSSWRFTFCKHVTELAELVFDGAEDFPHFARALLDGERAEADAEAVEDGRKGGRPGDDDAMLTLQALDQARMTKRLGVETLGREEENREVGRQRRVQVLAADVFGRILNRTDERALRLLHRGGVAVFARLDEA